MGRKFGTFLIASLAATYANAGTIKAKVNYSFCGEVAPFSRVNSCLVFLNKDNSEEKIAIVLDSENKASLLAYLTNEALVEINLDESTPIKDKYIQRILKDYDPNYDYVKVDMMESIQKR